MDARPMPAARVDLLRRLRAGNWQHAERVEDAECLRFPCPLGEPANDRHTAHMITTYVDGRMPDRAEPGIMRCRIVRTRDGYLVQFKRAPGHAIGCQWVGPLLVHEGATP